MNQPVLLSKLLNGCEVTGSGDCELSGITMDSRAVTPGAAFFALQGSREHGLRHLDEALANGAVALVHDGAEPLPELPSQFTAVAVHNLRKQLGKLAAGFYGTAANEPKVLAVTGTNGKTSCAVNIAQVSNRLQKRCAVVGTLGWGVPPDYQDTGLTTPDVFSMHRIVAQLRSDGCSMVAMEASSHALDQGRLDGLPVHTAVFTNLSRDHLDYHNSFEEYGQAKARLFQHPGLRHVVINDDDEYATKLRSAARFSGHILGYSLGSPSSELYATDISLSETGISANVHTPWGHGSLQLPLIGRFNLQNALAVLAAQCLQGFEFAQVLAALGELETVPGRMHLLNTKSWPRIIVDYAHTPDALAQVLQAVRGHCAGKLWLVFGCGGDRDRGKRPQMAQAAARYADHCVVTSDNPRTEDPDQIIADIMDGFSEQQRQEKVLIHADRERAIQQAVGLANDGDWLVIAGKGHETYQLIGTEKKAFDDRRIAQGFLKQRQSRVAGAP